MIKYVIISLMLLVSSPVLAKDASCFSSKEVIKDFRAMATKVEYRILEMDLDIAKGVLALKGYPHSLDDVSKVLAFGVKDVGVLITVFDSNDCFKSNIRLTHNEFGAIMRGLDV